MGGVGAQLELTLEALDDVQLATELMLGTLVREAAAAELTLDVAWDDEELTLTASPTRSGMPGVQHPEELERMLRALGARVEIERGDPLNRLRAVLPLSRAGA